MTPARYLAHLSTLSRISLKRWTRRALFLLGGISVGAAAVLMAMASDEAQRAYVWLLETNRTAAFLVTPLGFGIAAFLAARVFPNSQGSGIPQVIAALRLESPERRSRLVSLRLAIGKVVLMLLGFLCGASIGREGPTVQVGASIMAAFGRWAPFRQPGFVLAGASAGVAAAFNTPLAGIVFGIEEMSRSFEMRTSGLIIGAVIAAGLTSLAIVGDYSYFGSTSAVLPLGASWVVVPVCAVVCGLMGGMFARLVAWFAHGLPGRVGKVIKRFPVAFAVLCGFGVALCGVVGNDLVFGTGYKEARAIIHDAAAIEPGFGVLKFLATVLSSISGIPGGIFSPALATGVGLAADLRWLFPEVPIGALALIGMVSYLAGVVQAPITAFVIVAEMTDSHAMVIPLMAAALIAKAASRLVAREGAYHAIAKVYLARIEAVPETAPR